MTSPAGSVHKRGAGERAEVSRPQWTWCILRDCVDARHPKCRRLVAPEHPCRALGVEHNRVTTSARGVNTDSLDVAQRPEYVWFEKIRMTVKKKLKWGGGDECIGKVIRKVTHSESSVLPPRSLRPNFGLSQHQDLKLHSLVTWRGHAPVGPPCDQNWVRA